MARHQLLFVCFSILAFFSLTLKLVAQNPFDPDPLIGMSDSGSNAPASVKKIHPANSFADAKLEKIRIESALAEDTSLDYTECEWRNIEYDIESKHRISIYVQASGKLELAEDDLVSMNFSGLPLRDALELFLAERGLTYAVRQSHLIIGNAKTLAGTVEIIDCEWLLTHLDEDQVAELVRNAIGPPTDGKTLNFVGPSLVVCYQGPELHRLRELLHNLRQQLEDE